MTHIEHVPGGELPVASRKVDAAVWGLFFIWLGVALFLNVGWGLGLVGVGLIILVGQLARRYFALGVEAFWLVVRLLLILGGIWELVGVHFSLVPTVLIVAGLALLVSAVRTSRA